MRYALLLAAPFLIAAAGDMNVATFLQKADKLQGRGALAMFSGDLRLLMGEAKGAGQRWRASLDADKRAGRVPSSCPPAKVSMGAKEMIALLQRVPPAERARTTVTQAFTRDMARRFPCRS